jgi:hypothetical protein
MYQAVIWVVFGQWIETEQASSVHVYPVVDGFEAVLPANASNIRAPGSQHPLLSLASVVQVEPPAKAVTKAELAALPTDPSLPSLRERAHIAMRASGAAMEASQRAAAYSAAASSAASRAAEAAEQAAAAAAAIQVRGWVDAGHASTSCIFEHHVQGCQASRFWPSRDRWCPAW